MQELSGFLGVTNEGCGEVLEVLFRTPEHLLAGRQCPRSDHISPIAAAPAAKLKSLVSQDLYLHCFVDIAVR